MTCNIGGKDKVIRWIVGLAVLGAGFYFKSWWGLLGIIPIMTAIVGFCGLYKVLGISTCKDHPTQKPQQ